MKYIRIIGVFCILILFLTCCKNPESIDHNMEDDTSTDTGRQTSILRHEDSGDEYRIDINGVQADGISNISYTILCRYPQNENSFALLAENCIPEIDSGNVIHIPKSIPICSVYVPGDETFIPIYRMVKKGSDTWTTEYTSINKSESDIVDDLATSLTVTKTPGSEGRFVYSL